MSTIAAVMDQEKHSIDVTVSSNPPVAFDKAAERKLVRKTDLLLMPALGTYTVPFLVVPEEYHY